MIDVPSGRCGSYHGGFSSLQFELRPKFESDVRRATRRFQSRQVVSTFHVTCGSCCDSKRCFVPRWLQWRPSRFELSTRMAGDSSMYIRIAKASKKLQLGLCLRHQNCVTILTRQRVCKADVRRQGFTSKMRMLQFFGCEHSMILTAVFSNFQNRSNYMELLQEHSGSMG